MKPKCVTVIGRRWRDKVNGNTYHSARVLADGELVATVPFQYGYGNQFEWNAAVALEQVAAKLELPAREKHSGGSCQALWSWLDKAGVKLVTLCEDGLKRDCVAWGHA